jgi:hypothetical protein
MGLEGIITILIIQIPLNEYSIINFILTIAGYS